MVIGLEGLGLGLEGLGLWLKGNVRIRVTKVSKVMVKSARPEA